MKSSRHNFDQQRQKMVQRDIAARGIRDRRVLDAFRKIPRENFISEQYQAGAYDDNPIPIGMGQTISQPYIVALMTEKLAVRQTDEVLEIGTGCGYQTAILAKLAKKVYTVERHNQLSERAQAALAAIGIKNVEYAVADGTLGWPGGGQFNRIIVTAAMLEIPQPLTDQLKNDGLIVGPVGGRDYQNLILGRKQGDRLITSDICAVRFVPLIGENGHGQ